MAGDWNYLAGRVTGDGGIDIIETELPIRIDAINRTLSSAPTLTGTITEEVRRLKKDGRPIFEEWGTVIIAQADHLIRGMGIYQTPQFNGAEWKLNMLGFSGYPIGMPYDGSVYFIDTDPLDIFRHIWQHLQSQPQGNLGVTIDPLQSPVRVGKQIENVEFQTSEGQMVAFEAGPRKLNWWQSKDLGKEIDDYAKETPFDWLETNYWDGDSPHCHIRLGYPTIGRRKDNRRLVYGENLATEPSVTTGEYANAVIVVGAGEGRDSIRGYDVRSHDRLRRVKVVEDKSHRSTTSANAQAQRSLSAAQGELVVDKVEVYDHPNAPLEGIELGDEIPLYAELDHTIVDQWVRVVGRSDAPDDSDRTTLTIVRTAIA